MFIPRFMRSEPVQRGRRSGSRRLPGHVDIRVMERAGLGTFAGEYRELDVSDLPLAQNVGGVELTTAPVPVKTQPPTSAVRGAAVVSRGRLVLAHRGASRAGQ